MPAARAMPPAGPRAQMFEPDRVDYASPETGGQVGAIAAGFPVWRAMWTLGRLGEARSDEWRAWVASQRGAGRLFLGRDYARTFPRAYPAGFAGLMRAGGGAFNGAATSWGQSIDAEGTATITLGGLPAALALAVGDYLGFKWGDGRRAMVRAVQPAVASGSGVLAVAVEPPVFAVVPAGATAHLDSPCCLMRLITDETRLEGIDRGLGITGGVIAGRQVLLP